MARHGPRYKLSSKLRQMVMGTEQKDSQGRESRLGPRQISGWKIIFHILGAKFKNDRASSRVGIKGAMRFFRERLCPRSDFRRFCTDVSSFLRVYNGSNLPRAL